MLIDVIQVKYVQDYVLYLRFEDGLEGNIDISKHISFQGVFSRLKDLSYFQTVLVNSDIGTIVWDNGADISPSFLYSVISKAA